LINLALSARLLKADTVGYVLLLFLINLFLPIPARPIISQSNGPIFAKFSGLVKLWLYDQPETSFSVSQGTLPWQPIVVSSA